MRWVLVLLLCGCNQVFGLQETGQLDAAFFDAPADAPYACPPLGTAPRFAPQLTQFLVQRCDGYSGVTSGRAGASCKDGDGIERVFVGNRGEPLSIAPGVERSRDAFGVILRSPYADRKTCAVRSPSLGTGRRRAGAGSAVVAWGPRWSPR